MDLGLDGDTAIVTASSSGLGRGCAEAFVAEGANVVICGREEARLAAAETDVADAGEGSVLAVRADITDPDDVADLIAAAAEEFGVIDHLVTSAGGPPSGSFADTSEGDWYTAYDLLVMSAVRTIGEARPYLEAGGGGTITCIASTSVREVIDDLILSNAVRRAVVGLVKSISREFAPGVRVNAVLPGTHETARMEELIADALDRGEYDTYDEGLAEWAGDIPVERIGDPREFGDAVAFLASRRAGFVNGVALPIDGGKLRS